MKTPEEIRSKSKWADPVIEYDYDLREFVEYNPMIFFDPKGEAAARIVKPRIKPIERNENINLKYDERNILSKRQIIKIEMKRRNREWNAEIFRNKYAVLISDPSVTTRRKNFEKDFETQFGESFPT